MKKDTVIPFSNPGEIQDAFQGLLRKGVKELIRLAHGDTLSTPVPKPGGIHGYSGVFGTDGSL